MQILLVLLFEQKDEGFMFDYCLPLPQASSIGQISPQLFALSVVEQMC